MPSARRKRRLLRRKFAAARWARPGERLMEFRLKRIYEPAEKADGVRILVDRLWPRGMRKEEAHIDRWAQDIAPSAELRRWFGHDPEKRPEFRKRYEAELKSSAPEIRALLDAFEGRTVTLLYGAADKEHNQAVVLRNFMEKLADGR